MNKQTEALKMAIKSLEKYVGVVQHKFNAETWGDIEDGGKPAREAIQSCKEALAQPAQEGISKMETTSQPAQKPYCWLGYGMQAHDEKPFEGATPLYKHPAPTIKESLMVEPAQEPVAFTNEDELSELKSGMTTCYMYKQAIDDNDIALYTHPAPSWQGLDEYRHLKWCVEQYRDCVGFEQKSSKFQSVCEALDEVDAIEQALKEKNNGKDS